MNKFEVHISFVVRAEDRQGAYGATGDIIHHHLRDMASITSVSQKPLPNPEKWIAVNEPIREDPLKQSIHYHSQPGWKIK